MTVTNKPLLILDLDETLIHGAEVRLGRAEDFQVGPYFIYKRPYVEQFLPQVAQYFELAVWSSASCDYVEIIAKQLARVGIEWQFVWSRKKCTHRYDYEQMEASPIKDLRKVKKLGYDLEQVLIVDDTPAKVVRNYGNAIYVRAFEGNQDDNELEILVKYLGRIHGAPNYRCIEKRGWRHRTETEQ